MVIKNEPLTATEALKRLLDAEFRHLQTKAAFYAVQEAAEGQAAKDPAYLVWKLNRAMLWTLMALAKTMKEANEHLYTMNYVVGPFRPHDDIATRRHLDVYIAIED